MTADDTPAVPDTEAEREALAFLRPCDRAPGDLDAWLRESGHARDHAATIVRAALARDVPAPNEQSAVVDQLILRQIASVVGVRGRPEQWQREVLHRVSTLARDVPAGRDLTAQDVRDAHAAWLDAGREQQTHVEFAADYLNRIARPARDVPAPTDDPRGVAAVLALHRPVDGPLDSDDNRITVCDHCIDGYESPYEYPCPTVKALGVGVSDRAGDDELRRGSLVDADGACVQCGHLATSHRPETGECTKCRGQFACYAPGIRAGGGVTAGQDEPRELRGLIHDALQTVVEAVTELRQVNPGDLGADELDAARRKLIRARAIADRVGAAPAVDTAAPDPLRAPVEALLGAIAHGSGLALLNAIAEVRRHLDAPAPDPLRDVGDEVIRRAATWRELWQTGSGNAAAVQLADAVDRYWAVRSGQAPAQPEQGSAP